MTPTPIPSVVGELSDERDRLIHILVVHFDMFRAKAEEAADIFLHDKTLSRRSVDTADGLEAVAWVTEPSGLEVATITHDDFSLVEVVKSPRTNAARLVTIHRTSEETGRRDDMSIDLTAPEAHKVAVALASPPSPAQAGWRTMDTFPTDAQIVEVRRIGEPERWNAARYRNYRDASADYMQWRPAGPTPAALQAQPDKGA